MDENDTGGTSARLLQLLSLLQVHRSWSAGELSARLDVSARTVRRYIDRLRAMGYRVDSMTGPEGGYVLAAGASLPPLVLDDDQAIAVAVALQTAPAHVGGLREDAARALATITQVLPGRLRARVEAFDVVTVPDGRDASRPQVEADALEAIGLAIRRHERLRFEYVRGEDEQRREVEATHLVTYAGKWYVVAWDPSRDDWRTFRVDRMRLRSPGPRFVPRDVPGGIADYFAARFEQPGWLCRGTAILQRPAHEVLPWISGSDGVVEPLDEQSCRLTAGSWSWISLVAWFAMFDCPFTIEGGPELSAAQNLLAERLRR